MSVSTRVTGRRGWGLRQPAPDRVLKPSPEPPSASSPARPLWRALLRFLIPLMASNILQSLSGTVTSIYLGRMLGVSALAAVSAFFPILFFLVSFLIGFAGGPTVVIGQAYGERDAGRVRRVAGTMLTVSALAGCAIALLCSLFAHAILAAIGTPAALLPEALVYGRVVFLFMPVLFVYLAYTTVLRGIGDSRTPLYALCLSTAVSLVLTPAFIRGWAGLPRLGVASGAWAAVIAYLLALGALGLYLRRAGSLLAPNRALFAALGLDWPILKLLLRIGLPTGVQLVMVSLSEIAIVAFVNQFGADAIAAYGIGNQIINYVQFPAISVGIAASVFVAQAVGAGRPELLPRIARSALVLGLAIGGVLIAAVYLFARDLVAWFTADPQAAAIGYRLLLLTMWSYLVFGASSVLSGVMRGTGTVLWPTALSIAVIWGVEVPTAWLLSRRLGIDGVWLGYPAAFCAGLLLVAVYYAAVWRRRSHARLR